MAFALSELKVRSTDFSNDHRIPDEHSYQGGNISPSIHWQDLPEATTSVAVFCHDPDAPLVSATGNYGFVHWLVYNIPPDTSALPRGCKEYAQGKNNFGGSGYGGPKPPAGHGRHNYYFWVLALDLEPVIQDGLELAGFLEKVEPHVLGMNRVVGYFEIE